MVSLPHSPLLSQQSSRIFFLPLSRGNSSDDDDEDEGKDEDENKNEEKDEVNGRMDRRVNDRDERGAREAGNSGNGRSVGMEEASVPRGKGMQDIAAPRDTRGRNLHDEAGDVLQSYSPSTTKSLGSHI